MDKLEKFIIKELKKYNVIENKVVLLIEEDGSKLAQAVREGMKIEEVDLANMILKYSCLDTAEADNLARVLISQIKELIKW